jgi:hypothetical protein
LKQDDFAGKALSQDNVSFSDVGYNETGY